jgi:hypothetical protein
MAEEGQRVAIALAHLAAVDSGHHRGVVPDHGRGQPQHLSAIGAVDALGDVPRDLDVLHLVSADGHQVGVEEQDVGRHEHRVGVEADADAGVGVFDALVEVFGHLRLVGVGLVHPALGAEAGQHPGQLEDLGHVGLPVEDRAAGVQAEGQPGGGDLEGHGLQQGPVVGAREGVVVGDEEERAAAGLLGQLQGRADGAQQVADVGVARGLHAGEHDGGTGRGRHGGSNKTGRRGLTR